MKDITIMTNQELLNMTQEEIDQVIDYECAKEGVALTFDLPEEPEAIVSEPDLTLMSFKDFTVDPETGKKIQELLDQGNVYDQNYSTKSWKVINQDDYSYPNPQVKLTYTEEKKALEHKENYALKKQWEEYNSLRDEWQEHKTKREEIVERVYDQISSARVEENNRERMKKEWERYLTMANNDRSVAKQFFVDRYSVNQYDSLFGEHYE